MTEPKRLWVEIDLEYPEFGGSAYLDLTSTDDDEPENDEPRYLYISAARIRALRTSVCDSIAALEAEKKQFTEPKPRGRRTAKIEALQGVLVEIEKLLEGKE